MSEFYGDKRSAAESVSMDLVYENRERHFLNSRKKNRGTSRAVSNGHSCVSIGRGSHVRITPFSDNDAKGLDAWCSVGFDPRTREDVVRSFAGDETSSEVRLTFLASPDIGNINCYGTIGVRVGSCRIVGRRENRTW